jgi:hypothetical protein
VHDDHVHFACEEQSEKRKDASKLAFLLVEWPAMWPKISNPPE